MKEINKIQSKWKTLLSGKKRAIICLTAGMLIILSFLLVVMIKTTNASHAKPAVVVRIDDIQDYAFKDAQLLLINEGIQAGIPLSLAVIPGNFGADQETVWTVTQSINHGSDIAAHGWKHEDLSELSYSEQSVLLFQAKNRIKRILNFDTKTLIPPFYKSNTDTLLAMKFQGYSIISTLATMPQPAGDAGVISIPATVELSDFSNNNWEMKSLEFIKFEVVSGIQKYGFAIIVTHPQELLVDAKIDQSRVETYRNLLGFLKSQYSCKTLTGIAALQ
jgi:peptidoglycan/xylan/chitin deacetylase (PgdA/CDA1 family)